MAEHVDRSSTAAAEQRSRLSETRLALVRGSRRETGWQHHSSLEAPAKPRDITGAKQLQQRLPSALQSVKFCGEQLCISKSWP